MMVWFYRDYQLFSGGHLKFSHYINHVLAFDRWQPRVTFSSASDAIRSHLWSPFVPCMAASWNPKIGDVAFVAGKDWAYAERVDIPSEIPIINFIQGVRHADSKLPLYNFLNKKAIRICVSQQVADAITETGLVDGPIYVIPNGIPSLGDVPIEQSAQWVGEPKVLIVGNKKPDFASHVERGLSKLPCETCLIDNLIPREEFLKYLEESDIVVCCPLEEEGFYLPALEAMSLGALVVCPDCVGNRDFCIDRETALVPNYDVGGFIDKVHLALNLSMDSRLSLLNGAKYKSNEYTLERERESFHRILNDAYHIWDGIA